jgi:hypothetical protein
LLQSEWYLTRRDNQVATGVRTLCRRRPPRRRVPARRRVRPMATKAPRGQSKGHAEEGHQGRHESQTRPCQGDQHAARREQGCKDPGTNRAAQRGEPGRDRESHGLAETFDPGISLDRRKEARSQDRVHQDRGGRSRIPGQEIGFRIEIGSSGPPPARGWRLFLIWRVGP